MFCKKCGVALENDTVECPTCGKIIKENKKRINYEEKNTYETDLQYNQDLEKYRSEIKDNSDVNSKYNEDLESYRYEKKDKLNKSTQGFSFSIFIILLIINPVLAILYIFFTIIRENKS